MVGSNQGQLFDDTQDKELYLVSYYNCPYCVYRGDFASYTIAHAIQWHPAEPTPGVSDLPRSTGYRRIA